MERDEINNGTFDGESGNSTWTRIFVGGLGGAVTADDIRNTFSSLGTIKEIDIVRTNGRNFAYMNFYPNFDNALPKLFSMYNRCIWKGGRLKLERAKEHYLVRLRREWAEDTMVENTTPSSDVDVDEKKIVHLEKPKRFQKTLENGLHIFFPKLRKVKSLPLSGSGKHKYSFQRTEVPSLPLIFCDCEQHSGLSHIPTPKASPVLECQSTGIKDGEVGLMNSVMNKLLEKEKYSKDDGPSETVRSVEVEESIQLVNENELDHSVEDNMVMNYVSGVNMFSVNQESMISEVQKIKEKKIEFSSNKRKSSAIDAKDRLQSRKPSWKKLVDSSQYSQFSLSRMLPKSGGPESSHTRPDCPDSGGLDVGGLEFCAAELGELESDCLDRGGPEAGGIKSGVPEPDCLNLGERGLESDCLDLGGPEMGGLESGISKAGGLKLDCPDSDEAEAGRLELGVSQPCESKLDGSDSGGLEASGLKMSGGQKWKQKSSWTKLVGKEDTCSFSIADIVNMNGSDLAKSVLDEAGPEVDPKSGSGEDFVSVLELHENESLGSSKMVDLDKKDENLSSSNEKDWLFMRSDGSLKEWATLKRTLGGSQRKRKD